MGPLAGLSLLSGSLLALEIQWQTADQGGGRSSGGGFVVTGTVGQPDIGTSAGGNLSLTGGFWAYLSLIQTEGAPLLSIHRDPGTGNLVVTWPLPDDGWVLEQGSGLDGATVWEQVPPGDYSSDGSNRSVPVPEPTDKTFYRLTKP